MHLLVKSIEVDGHIIAVKLSAYDTDGQEGVYIPGSEDINALKEVGANIGGSMGTSLPSLPLPKTRLSPRLPVG